MCSNDGVSLEEVDILDKSGDDTDDAVSALDVNSAKICST